MKRLINFKQDESGAVTVDWVVLTSAIVGIGISVVALISTGVESATGEVGGGLETASNFTFSFTPENTDWNGMNYWDYRGIAETEYGAAGNAGATSGWINILAEADAPDGYTFTGYNNAEVDAGMVYISADGQSYSINGEVTAVADYAGNLNQV